MKIILPFSVNIPRKTKEDRTFALNLNIYRNTHHMILNKAKELWDGIVNVPAGTKLPVEFPCLFIYRAFPETNRKFDLGNVLSIVQKFTDDVLISRGVITDDSYKIIPAINYRFGHVDKDNPRIELDIKVFTGDSCPECHRKITEEGSHEGD